MYVTLHKRLLSPISQHQNHSHNMYLFCTLKLLRVYKADAALKVPQEFTEKHKLWLLVVFRCFGVFVGLLVCLECLIHPEAFCFVSVLYSNKGVFLSSTAYSKMIKPRHCSELILSMVPIILPIQRCPFSSSFKASRRARLNLNTRTVLYRQVTSHWITEACIIAFRLLYSKSENCHSGSYAADWRANSGKVEGHVINWMDYDQNPPRKVAWYHMPGEPCQVHCSLWHREWLQNIPPGRCELEN